MERVLKHTWLKSAIFLLCLLATAQLTFATTFIIPSDDDLIIGARAIVTGKVLSIESGFDKEQERIYTYITVRVKEVLKGQITERKIVLKELGGQVGDRGLTVFGNPQLERGEKVLLYLDTWKDGSLRTYQMLMGKFSIVKDETTGHEFVERSSGDNNVTVLRPQSHNGQPDGAVTDRMEFSTYKHMVRNILAANRERSRQFERTYYRHIPVLAQPAEYSEMVRRGGIQPAWVYISTAHPRWFQPDSGQPVTFKVNTDGAPGSQIMNDVTAALDAWSTIPNTNLQLVNGGTTTACQPSSSTNVILFNNCDGRWSASPTCSGTLALGGLGWTGATTVINGVTFHQATSGFVSFNPYASCFFGTACNVREVMTHELGHAIGLGHTTDSTATMYAQAHFDGRCAGVKQDDMSAIQFIYPGSGGGGPPPLAIATSSLPGGTLGTFYSQALAATGGTPPYGWSVLSGSLPAGLSLSAAGVISGTPSNAATYNFTVQVADAASNTAQKALSIAITQAAPNYASLFVSQTVPTTLTPGQAFNATMSWVNVGTLDWDGGTGLRLISQNPQNNTTWGGNTVLLSSYFVAQGQQLNVTFQAVAPTTPGNYNFQWTVAANASTPFGQQSTNLVIQVGSGGGGGTNNAAFVSQSVPSSLTVNQSASVSVTFNNTGSTTWAAGSYLLTSLNPQGNGTWGLTQVQLASAVAPGANRTFTFNITAPSSAGTYNFQWGMIQSGVGLFGSPSTNVAVNVTGGGGGAGNQAQFVSQTVPGAWVAGQTYSVIVRMKNTGTTSWIPSSHKLGSQNPANNMTWGRNRATITKNVTPGSTAIFTFTVTVPIAAGTYNFQWQMIQEGVAFFGDKSSNISVTVGGGGGGGTNNAAFVSQSVPSSLTVNQSVNVSLTFNNSGTTTWAPGSYLLTSLNPLGNSTWGVSQVQLGSSIAPGGNATFAFNVTAPGVAGSYNFQWGMMQSGVGTFGSASTNVSINVTGGGGATNNAMFISQNPPTSMTPGQTRTVTITMRNNGSTTWAAGAYSLQSQNPAGNTTWGTNRVNLASPVSAGSDGTFSFSITAPGSAGSYNFQWRMAQDGVGPFGDLTPNVSVNVSSSGGGPLAITTAGLNMATKNQPYNQQMNASGGTSPYTWSVSAGSLPTGLTLNSSTGVISGTPTVSGSRNVTILVTDQNGATASKSYFMFVM
ncbi:MAG TPA: NBR1-Ig-like domain-containing protein [Blastocatellia bacterium]|nr:NBR1-Ig-like domain-containing protein [Blastocatellia bacterium]